MCIESLAQEIDRMKGEAEVLRGLLRDAYAVLSVIEEDADADLESMIRLRARIASAIDPKQPSGGLF